MAGPLVADGAVDQHYNGKLVSPALIGRVLGVAELDAVLLRPLPPALRRDLVAFLGFLARHHRPPVWWTSGRSAWMARLCTCRRAR